MKTLIGTLGIILLGSTIGVGLPVGGMKLANRMNSNFVRNHSCPLMSSTKPQIVVIFGLTRHMPSESFYKCSNPDTVVIVDGENK